MTGASTKVNVSSTLNEYNGQNSKRVGEKQVLKDNSNSKNSKIFQPVTLSGAQINQGNMINHKRCKSQSNLSSSNYE